jgi:hypothetical protein
MGKRPREDEPPDKGEGPGPRPPPRPCATCGGRDHERSSNKLCPHYKPRTSTVNKRQLAVSHEEGGAVEHFMTSTTVKPPLLSLLRDGVPATMADAWGSLALDFTLVSVAASLLIGHGVASWLAQDRQLPQLDQTLLRRILFFVIQGDYNVGENTHSWGVQRPFLMHLRSLWLDGENALRTSFPSTFDAAAGEHRLLQHCHSNEIMHCFNGSFRQYQTVTETHLTKACNRNLNVWAKQAFNALPWNGLEEQLPKEQRNALFGATLSALRSRRRPFSAYTFVEGAPDGQRISEAQITQAVQEQRALVYGWKTPSMAQARTVLLPAAWLAGLLVMVHQGRTLYLTMKGEFGLWLDETWEDVFALVPRFASVAQGRLKKTLLKAIVDGTTDRWTMGEGQDQDHVHPTLDMLRGAANNGAAVAVQYASGAHLQRRTLPPPAVLAFVDMVDGGIERYAAIRANLGAGGVDDWNGKLRFLLRTNELIVQTFPPPTPPLRMPEHWTPPLPPTSQLLPVYNFTTKYIAFTTDQALPELVARHKRLYPEATAAWLNRVFGPGVYNHNNTEHQHRLWDVLFDVDKLMLKPNGQPIYKPGRLRLFRYSIASDGVGSSVTFDKRNGVRPPEATRTVAEDDRSEDDEAQAVREAAKAKFHDSLRQSYRKAAEWEEASRRGECVVRRQALDPGAGHVTLARLPDGENNLIGDDGHVRKDLKTFDYAMRKYYAESGIKKRQKKQEELTKQTMGADGRTIQRIIQDIPPRSATGLEALRARARYILTHLSSLVTFYAQFRNARFQNYRGKQVTLARMTKELLAMEQVEKRDGAPRTNETAIQHRANRRQRQEAWRPHTTTPDGLKVRYILVWGTAKVGSMTWIKKHLRGPMKKLVASVEARSDVVIVFEDEFNTSKCCAGCHQLSLDAPELPCCPKARDMTPSRQGTAPKWHPPVGTA